MQSGSSSGMHPFFSSKKPWRPVTNKKILLFIKSLLFEVATRDVKFHGRIDAQERSDILSVMQITRARLRRGQL